MLMKTVKLSQINNKDSNLNVNTQGKKLSTN